MTETALGNRDILVKIWWSVWAVGLMNFLGLLGIVIVLADR